MMMMMIMIIMMNTMILSMRIMCFVLGGDGDWLDESPQPRVDRDARVRICRPRDEDRNHREAPESRLHDPFSSYIAFTSCCEHYAHPHSPHYGYFGQALPT
jgi:hypothetical protein